MAAFLKPELKNLANLLKPEILRRFKEGRGQGHGKDYKPFLSVRDVPSKGRVHRRPSIKHGRVVHLLSDLELVAFIFFDWLSIVIDIREQFPLDLEKTINLASRLGIKHPAYKGVLQVMTTDLLVELMIEGEIVCHAVSVKYREHLEDERTLEKQELERAYWESLGIKWFIFTEQEVTKTLSNNISWLIPHIHSHDLGLKDREAAFGLIKKAIELNPDEKIAVVMSQIDVQQNEKVGTYLSFIRHFLAQRAIVWDMNKVSSRSLRTSDLQISDLWMKGEQAYVHAQ